MQAGNTNVFKNLVTQEYVFKYIIYIIKCILKFVDSSISLKMNLIRMIV